MAQFVDASFWIALLNPRDTNHRRALEAMAEISAAGGLAPPIVYTDYVFSEVVTTTLARTRRHDRAVEAGRVLLASKGARMVRISERLFDEAWALFQKRRDKRWSFTDCASFCVMDALGIRSALSFDPDFRQAGYAVGP